jgi:predicted  nucleic acid-binding Zn-ribbon protein
VDNETVDSLLNKMAAVLEEHTVIAVNHRQNLEHLSKEVAQLKTRLEKLEARDSDKSDDAKFIAEMTARLKAILDSLRAKD